MAPPGARASSFLASTFWNSLAAALDDDPALLFCLTPQRSGNSFVNPAFFRHSLFEIGSQVSSVASGDRIALELTALTLDHFLAKPFSRVGRGAAISPFSFETEVFSGRACGPRVGSHGQPAALLERISCRHQPSRWDERREKLRRSKSKLACSGMSRARAALVCLTWR